MTDQATKSTERARSKHSRRAEASRSSLWPRTDEQAALAARESNQLLYLRLRKWHYAGALNFIRQVEEAAQM
ncbi:hypothetical protein BGW80DRAFT_1303906, partial [Lactifluus volemus]